jgi:23S rRNA pseudouridine1911/1915/1917 synthase
MDENVIIITAQESGDRVDALLARSVETLTRSAAQRLIENGSVTLFGEPVKKNYRCAPGDEFEIILPPPEDVPLLPQNIPLDVVYEDGDVIVVNKPRGMVVHPAPGHPDGTLVNALLYRCGDSLSGVGGEKRPGIVHRIDKDTSGLIIAAKNDLCPSGAVGPAFRPQSFQSVPVCGAGPGAGRRGYGVGAHRPLPQ